MIRMMMMFAINIIIDIQSVTITIVHIVIAIIID